MTTIEGALVSLLNGDEAVSGMIGGRIHPSNDPQTIAYPKVTYQQLRTSSGSSVGGFTNDGPTGYEVATFQIECWANSGLTAKQGILAVRNCLNGYSGTVDDILICSIRKTDERELSASPNEGQQKPAQRYMCEINVAYSAT